MKKIARIALLGIPAGILIGLGWMLHFIWPGFGYLALLGYALLGKPNPIA